MTTLIESLAAELERPRELSARVLNYIGGTYSVAPDAIAAFLVEGLPQLEDDEIDLILSPVFTPKFADQAVFADLLCRDSVPREQWPELVQQLAVRPTRAQLLTPDGRSHSVILRDVTIARYVNRLRLDGTISASLLKLVDGPLLKAVARRAIWESEARRNILERYLINAAGRNSHVSDAIELLELVERYKPVDLTELLGQISHRQEVVRQHVNNVAKPFFSAEIQERHGGGRDVRTEDNSDLLKKQNELVILERLQQVLCQQLT